MAEEQEHVRFAPPTARIPPNFTPADPLSAMRRCPFLQAEVAKLRAQIPEKYLVKQPVLVGPGRTVGLTPVKS